MGSHLCGYHHVGSFLPSSRTLPHRHGVERPAPPTTRATALATTAAALLRQPNSWNPMPVTCTPATPSAPDAEAEKNRRRAKPRRDNQCARRSSRFAAASIGHGGPCLGSCGNGPPRRLPCGPPILRDDPGEAGTGVAVKRPRRHSPSRRQRRIREKPAAAGGTARDREFPFATSSVNPARDPGCARGVKSDDGRDPTHPQFDEH